MLKIGDRVVYPIYGTARVTDIRRERIGGGDHLCYILESDAEDHKKRPVIKLPVEKVSSREIIDDPRELALLELLRRR